MTELLIDLASYQDGIDLAAVKAAGFSKVNVKLSQGNWYQWSRAGAYINQAKDLGMGISTFHWLDNSADGATQARIVLGLMRRYGVLDGTAHQCDCEDSQRPATEQIWRDYMSVIQDGLGRHVINYTGDWWWQPRGWHGADLTPYLWAAPNNGYDGAYAGDQSDHWRAGYGGWGDYSMLQYAVQPIAGAGGGDLSKTAIRDPQVWAALTGGTTVTTMDLPADLRGAITNIHNVLAGVTRGNPYSYADGGAIPILNDKLDLLLKSQGVEQAAIDALAARPTAQLTITPETVGPIAAAIGAVLVAHPDNPLGDADQPALKKALEQYFSQHFAAPAAG